MNGFLQRVTNILIRPRSEWREIREETATNADILLRYVCLLAMIPPAAAVAERYLFGRGIVSNAVHSPFGYVLAANILWYFVIVVNMIITAVVITAITQSTGTGWVGLRGLHLASYSYTPLFIVGILTIIPTLGWLVYPAILYSLCLLYLGIRAMTGAGRRKAAWHAFASFLATGAIVGLLNGIEYMLESFIAEKVFF